MTRGEWQTLYDSNNAFKTNTILYFVIKNLILSFHEQDKVFSSDLGSKIKMPADTIVLRLSCLPNRLTRKNTATIAVLFNKTESAIELALWLRKKQAITEKLIIYSILKVTSIAADFSLWHLSIWAMKYPLEGYFIALRVTNLLKKERTYFSRLAGDEAAAGWLMCRQDSFTGVVWTYAHQDKESVSKRKERYHIYQQS